MTQWADLNPGSAGDTNWKIVGTGDFNNDGKPDILWQHQTQGALVVWYMNGTTMTKSAYLNPSSVADLNWKIVGAE